MSYETVNIYVLDQNNTAVQNAIVRFFDSAGTALTTQGVSDASGLVSVLLPSGTLTVRCYKFSVQFGAPTTIEILENQTNAFSIYGQVLEVPTSPDSRLCMAYGYFRRESGAPYSGVDIHFAAKFDPLLLDGTAVMPSRLAARTDDNGYTQITLIRNGQYDVTIQGDRDLMREITVPDLGSVNLPDLLFPVVEKVEFDIAVPWAIPIGSSLDVIPTVYLSDGRVLEGTARNDVNWCSSDDSVVGVSVGSEKLTLQGRAAGVAEMSVVRSDYTIIRIPDVSIQGQPVTVTVS